MTTPRPWAVGRAAALAVAALAVLGLLGWVGAPAAQAHEGAGTIVVEAAEPAGPLEVTYRVRLTYNADGHGADDATVTVVAEGVDGPTTPVPMTPADDDGGYGATVRFGEPGPWTVRFTAVTPPATLELTETVASAPPPSTAEPTTTTTSAAAPTTATSATPPSTSTALGSDDDDGAGGGVPVAPLVAGGVGAAVVAGVAVARRRR